MTVTANPQLGHVLSRLSRVQESGGEWSAECPAHQDRQNSLCIGEADDGKVLLHCQAGCETSDILTAAGLKWGNLFPKRHGNGQSRAVTIYDYRDADGALVFQVCRFAPKDFRQRRPDGNGGFVWNTKGISKPLYRLPELNKADPEQMVYVVEGEKDCDRLHSHGLSATTCAGGAKKWSNRYSSFFKGRHVCIAPDNDEPGRQHAEQIAQSLYGKAASVRILDLPGLPEKGDVSDWLDNGGTPDGLAMLAAVTHEWQPDSQTADYGKPKICTDDVDLPKLTRQAWEALQAANDPPTLFRSGSLPSRIESDDEGNPAIRELTIDRMMHHLARAAHWTRIRGSGDKARPVPTPPPKYVVRDVLATPDPQLPVLTRIVESPVFASDGSLLTDPGYHAKSRTYYSPAPGFEIPAISDNPTEDERQQAAELLTDELLGDFPFTSESEKAHAVALLLLPLARDLIRGPTPLHLIEKPTPGTGATLMVDALIHPATGHPVSAMTEGRDDDEWRKRIYAKLRSGPVAFLLDNIRRRLESSALASAITAWPEWEDRLLGKSESIRVPVRCVWIATGNNPAVSSEMARRIVRIRLDAKVDRPWLRTGFRHDDLRGWAKANRPRLVWAALTLIRTWIAEGRPEGQCTIGMFESWAKVMGGILDVADIPGFLQNINEFYDESDADGQAWRAFVAAWWDQFATKEKTVADLFPVATNGDLLDLGTKGEQSQKIRLGKKLAENRDRVLTVDIDDGERTLRIERGKEIKRARLWRLTEVSKPAW